MKEEEKGGAAAEEEKKPVKGKKRPIDELKSGPASRDTTPSVSGQKSKFSRCSFLVSP